MSAVLPLPALGQVAGGSLLGRVRDTDGAAVFAVTVLLEVDGEVFRAVESDRLGFYRMDRVPAGSYPLRTVRLGFEPIDTTVVITDGGEVSLDIVLARDAVELEGLSVAAERSRERIRFEEIAGATVREISLDEVRRVPGVAEADPIRAIEVLPGVVSTSDLSASFHVRGGSSDQNLILLDGVPVFSPFHLGGFFSVFNADMLDRVELQSGGFPAEHGGRVSSVLSVETDPGDGTFELTGGVSLLASRLAASGGLSPRLREGLGLSSARWRVSARRSYFDVVFKPFFDFPYHLTDLQGVFEAWTPGGDRLELTAYHGRDALNLLGSDSDFPLRIQWDWGNDLVGARWTRPNRRGGFMSVDASFSQFGSGLSFPDFGDTDFRTHIEQVSLGADFDARPRPDLRLELGVEADRLAYDNLIRSGGTDFNEGAATGWLFSAYGQVDWRQEGRWLVEAGVRFDGWRPSPGDALLVSSPRLALKRFLGDGSWAVKAAAGRYTQFLHSLRDEELPLGLDIWVLAGERAPHVESDQIQLGIETQLSDGWEVSLEAYHRSFDGVVTFNPADDPNDDFDDVISGDGTSYGADLLIKRSGTDVNGWLTLSFLDADRSFEDYLSPLEPRPTITYSPVFDRRLDVDLVIRFPFYRGWDAGLRWNLGTGVPYTRSIGSYAFYRPRFAAEGGRFEWAGAEGSIDPLDEFAILLGDRNGERYPAYHRLDFSLRKEHDKSWGSLTPYLSILNVYNRRNVLFYFFEYEQSPPTRSGVSMFPFLPTLGLEITFR